VKHNKSWGQFALASPAPILWDCPPVPPVPSVNYVRGYTLIVLQRGEVVEYVSTWQGLQCCTVHRSCSDVAYTAVRRVIDVVGISQTRDGLSVDTSILWTRVDGR